jgi:hypothetical protein
MEAGESPHGTPLRKGLVEPTAPAAPVKPVYVPNLHGYDAPDTIARFAANPANVPPVMAEMFRAEAAIISKATPQAQGQSLLEFVRSKGLVDSGGELAAMDIDHGLQRGKQKVIRPDGIGIDAALQLATERGYLPENAGIPELLDALSSELQGNPTYAHTGQDTHAPEWFNSIARANRRTGKQEQGDPAAVARALEQTAAGNFAKLPPRMQEYVLSALDHIDRLTQSASHEIDGQDLRPGDRFMTSDMQHHTVTAERDGLLILDDGSTRRIDDLIQIVGSIDQSGRPPERGYDPLDYDVESLLTERGDFTISTGTDAAGNPVVKSAREFIDENKNQLASMENRKYLYDRAAACMGLEF